MGEEIHDIHKWVKKNTGRGTDQEGQHVQSDMKGIMDGWMDGQKVGRTDGLMEGRGHL